MNRRRHSSNRSREVATWTPGLGTSALWVVLGTVLALGGIVAFALVYAAAHGDFALRVGGAAGSPLSSERYARLRAHSMGR